MNSVFYCRAYQDLDQKIQSIPFAGTSSCNPDQYVTEKSMGGVSIRDMEDSDKPFTGVDRLGFQIRVGHSE